MAVKTSLTVVVPVYNEADALPDFLSGLIPLCASKGWEVIFVNDGSTDDSAGILDRYKNNSFVKIVRHKINRGYGRALKTGIINASTPYVVTIDSDGQHNIGDIETMFRYSLETDADMVVGDRGNWRNTGVLRGLGKWLIHNFTRLLMPLSIHDLNSGFKLYRTELAKKYLHICPDSMAFSDVITLTFISQRDLVLEIPISMRTRRTGKSTIGLRTAFDTIIEIVNITLLFNPLKIFLPASFLCMLVGFGWGLPFALAGRGVSVGAMLAIVLGALFFVIGLLASQLSAIRMERLEDTRPGDKKDEE